ncbi:MAG: hypothetical protein QOI59_5859 [Gammaproteobacteria bacterium]|nr:hypothetical protein [Gammaproteobacteria bacterium]
MPIESKTFRPLEPPEPWRSFLRALDSELKGAVTLRCLGGFVVTQQYGIGRSTGDIDFLSISTMSAKMMSKPLVGSGRACIRSIVSTFNMSASQLHHATMPTDCRKCILTRRGITYDCSPWTRLMSLSPSWNATQIGTERICLDWRALVILIQTC